MVNAFPRYNDDEVKVFHPFFEHCAKEASERTFTNPIIELPVSSIHLFDKHSQRFCTFADFML